ncbi:MAG TPA: serine hydrolase domain-containing protein [Luteimonas sp.]|nr:serine hydrolase domain-containing protein [Luteimonas sp.]HRP72478.1 serine hydrolase domain-containing protein [Luteimonas sp.]
MTRPLALLLACCLPLALLAQSCSAAPAELASPSESGTDAAQQALDGWLDAFNSGERAPLEAFRDRWKPDMDVDRMLELHAETGGFRRVRGEPAEPGTARALLQELESDTVVRMEMIAKAGEPVRFGIRVIDPPEDLRVPRMTATAALDALVAKADEQAAKDAFSGVLLVANGDEVLLQRAWGQDDRAARTSVTPDTKFRIGSMNKMFTAVATLQLVQAGKLSLDGTVGQYLPGYPNAEIAKVTVRQLLTHSGGTGDFFGPEFDARRLSLKTHDDYVRLFGARGPTHPPGAEQRYSNYGFLLLGAIIERVSGQSYYDYVDAHVFAPAGMHDSGSLPDDVAVPGRAVAYMRKDGAWVDAVDTLPYRGTAAGGGYSTAGDLLKFARALLAGKLLSPELLAEATRNQTPWYGYGFMTREQEGVRMFGHAGGAPGMNGDLRVYPELGIVVVGLANVDPPAADRLVGYYLLRMPLSVTPGR